MEPNVNLNGSDIEYIYIPSGSTYNDVVELLSKTGFLMHVESFKWVAEKKNYPNSVKAGKFKIKDGMNNNVLVNLLRSGKQEPVRLIFNKVRTKDRFSGIIANQIEADSTEILKALTNEQYLVKYDKNLATAMSLFIPNTYEFWWNTDTDGFMDRMYKEYNRFWNDSRKDKAKKLNMSADQIITLASIVEEETNKNDEKNRLAGVYINRLVKGYRLQADPTLKFAHNDFEIKRVLDRHKKINSPYNTYKYYGLPPGPICIPSISSIDAVLNHEKHNYLYFCAKDDFSGYHVFAKTLNEHNRNAYKYHRALNKRRIYR